MRSARSAWSVARMVLGESLVASFVLPGNTRHHLLRVAGGDLGEEPICRTASQHGHHLPLDAAMGGAKTMYPEYQLELEKLRAK